MTRGDYNRQPRLSKVKVCTADRAIIEQRMGPLRERAYRSADKDDFAVAVIRLRFGGIVRSITGKRR